MFRNQINPGLRKLSQSRISGYQIIDQESLFMAEKKLGGTPKESFLKKNDMKYSMTEYDTKSWGKKSIVTNSMISRDGTGKYTGININLETMPLMIDEKFDREEKRNQSFDIVNLIN